MVRIDEVLLEAKIPEMAIKSAKSSVGDDPEALWRHFVSIGKVTEQEIFQAVARVYRLQYVELHGRDIPADALSTIPSDFARSQRLIPLENRGEKLFIGTPNPDNFTAIDEISAMIYKTIVTVIVSPSELQEALDRYLRADEEIDKLSEEIEQAAGEEEIEEVAGEEDQSPIVRFANLLITQAIQDRASDIHVEPGEKALVIRYRIDGVLHQVQETDKSIQQGVVSRLKVMSNIDIGEKRKPQDGRMSIRYNGKNIDIRVVTLPTSWGEKVVMRILDHSNERRSIASINMTPRNEEIFSNAISKPHGMVLVTGPTGSGKSLPLDTRIPTPDGFTTMDEISEGDEIIGGDGKVYSVTSTSPVDEYAEMYEITFSDGQKVIADADHQWLVSTASGRAINSSKKKKKAINDYVESHKALTKIAYLSLEFTSEFGSRTSEEILSIIQKEGIQYYSSPQKISQSLRMVDVYGNYGVRPVEKNSSKTVKVLEYPIENALMGLATRIREQHAVVHSAETPVVRATTREMLENGLFVGKEANRKNYAIPVSKAVELPEKDLLIDPYIFGLWLGDGSKDSGTITIGQEDQDELLSIIENKWNAKPYVAHHKNSSAIRAIMKRPNPELCIYGHNDWVKVGNEREYLYCKSCGTATRNTTRRTQAPVNGSLGELLAHLNVRGNKHIPVDYLRASFEQRLSLLQGIIDSDGHISKTGSVELCFANKTLTEDSVRLIRSLGIKASVRYNQSGGYKNINGELISKTRHRISFTTDLEVALLSRKKKNIPSSLRSTSKWNYITEIKPVGVQPAKCISVNSPDFTYLIGDGFIVTSNSTTIYTALGEVSKPTVNVITVEDPVEKKIAGISQMQINNKAGMTFSNALRSILRADPDIVFLGEIRDAETAKIAVDASMTGHLVLSTLHTNGAPEAAARLSEMGVEPYLVGSSVTCVVAQRLARKLCDDCKTPVESDPAILQKAGFPYNDIQLYKPNGCSICSNTGYRGRIALTEVLEINEPLEPLIIAQASANEIRREAEKHGFVGLREDGWIKVKNGLTTIEEVLRVAA